MAFLKPANLKLMQGVIPAEAVTDAVIGVARQDMKIFYIDVMLPDVNASYTSGTILIEYDDNAGGADTAIDTITCTTPALITSVTIDDLTLTGGIVPAGSRIIATVATLAGVSENFAVVNIWYMPLETE